LRILLIHNSYQKKGGEDALFAVEQEMLRAYGHQTVTYIRSNDDIELFNSWRRLRLPVEAVWASESYTDVLRICQTSKPEIAILFNTFPLVSPAVIYACRRAGVPVLQHFQNYRLVCSAGTLFRDGGICQECVDHGLWRGIWHGCYRESRVATAAVAAHLAFHRAVGTWSKHVNGFLAPSRFILEFAVRAGIERHNIYLKPNCLAIDPGGKDGWEEYALYAGRLSPEKGLWTLLKAWCELQEPIRLYIAGDGPLRPHLEEFVKHKGLNCVKFLGNLSRDDVLNKTRNAKLCIIPTECFEGFPMAVIEALACSAPIVASEIGALRELISEGQTGFFFPVNDCMRLAKLVRRLWHSPGLLLRVSAQARKEYQTKYTGEQSHRRLMEICDDVIAATSRQQTTIPNRSHRLSWAGRPAPKHRGGRG